MSGEAQAAALAQLPPKLLLLRAALGQPASPRCSPSEHTCPRRACQQNRSVLGLADTSICPAPDIQLNQGWFADWKVAENLSQVPAVARTWPCLSLHTAPRGASLSERGGGLAAGDFTEVTRLQWSWQGRPGSAKLVRKQSRSRSHLEGTTMWPVSCPSVPEVLGADCFPRDS